MPACRSGRNDRRSWPSRTAVGGGLGQRGRSRAAPAHRCPGVGRQGSLRRLPPPYPVRLRCEPPLPGSLRQPSITSFARLRPQPRPSAGAGSRLPAPRALESQRRDTGGLLGHGRRPCRGSRRRSDCAEVAARSACELTRAPGDGRQCGSMRSISTPAAPASAIAWRSGWPAPHRSAPSVARVGSPKEARCCRGRSR